MGWMSIIGCAYGIMLAFSGYYDWINDIYAMLGSGVALVLGILFIGQAKTLEALTILNARMKSRFAMEGLATGAASLGESTKAPPIIPQRKERVVKISDEDARRSGLKTR